MFGEQNAYSTTGYYFTQRKKLVDSLIAILPTMNFVHRFVAIELIISIHLFCSLILVSIPI